jgi:hypothetical protein
MDKAAFVAFAICLQCVLGAQVKVPFVGCPTHGQVETLEPPRGEPVAVPVSVKAARDLAYYKAEHGLGALAPRGGYCSGTQGSTVDLLLITREPFDVATRRFRAFDGPAIELSIASGAGSGVVVRGCAGHTSASGGMLPGNPLAKSKCAVRSIADVHMHISKYTS